MFLVMVIVVLPFPSPIPFPTPSPFALTQNPHFQREGWYPVFASEDWYGTGDEDAGDVLQHISAGFAFGLIRW
jgi:hypothetical protein